MAPKRVLHGSPLKCLLVWFTSIGSNNEHMACLMPCAKQLCAQRNGIITRQEGVIHTGTCHSCEAPTIARAKTRLVKEQMLPHVIACNDIKSQADVGWSAYEEGNRFLYQRLHRRLVTYKKGIAEAKSIWPDTCTLVPVVRSLPAVLALRTRNTCEQKAQKGD